MSFYRTCMRCASPILFWVAVVTFVVTLLFSLLSQWGLLSTSLAPAYGGDQQPVAVLILTSLAAALGGAVWPFMGSAIIWHLSRRSSGDTVGKAE